MLEELFENIKQLQSTVPLTLNQIDCMLLTKLLKFSICNLYQQNSCIHFAKYLFKRASFNLKKFVRFHAKW